MKTKEEIGFLIKSLNEEMSEMTDERNRKKSELGGIGDEENEDYFSDISTKSAQVSILEYIIK